MTPAYHSRIEPWSATESEFLSEYDVNDVTVLRKSYLTPQTTPDTINS